MNWGPSEFVALLPHLRIGAAVGQDKQIAAAALMYGLTVVTRNVPHYELTGVAVLNRLHVSHVIGFRSRGLGPHALGEPSRRANLLTDVIDSRSSTSATTTCRRMPPTSIGLC